MTMTTSRTDATPELIAFELDGREVMASAGETLWQVARREGTELPHLCYSPEPGYRPDGNCRACMVEIEGERVLAASCIRKPAPGMKVKTSSDRASKARRMVFELLVADQPARATGHDPNSRFWQWAEKVGVDASRFPARHGVPRPDRSHPAMAVHLDACAMAGVVLVEQPLPEGRDQALAGMSRPIPVCADESVHDRASLAALSGKYDAVNIKLDKTGGLTEALAMAQDATAQGFAILAGCMVATSLSMAPAMLLAQTARFADLDGPLLLARDRDSGLRYAGSLVYPADPALWG